MKVSDEVEVLIKDLDDTKIESILGTWNDINNLSKKLKDLDEMLRTKIKTYLKERKWESYSDEDTKISVRIGIQQREVINKKQLKLMLTDAQYAQVSRIVTSERLSMITPETRERLKKIVRKKI